MVSSDSIDILLAAFMLKEKLICFDNIPLLSARDIKQWIVFKLYKQISEDDLIEQIMERHCRRQTDINNAYKKQKLMC